MNLICFLFFQLAIVDVTVGHSDFEFKKANYTPVRSHGKSLPEKEDISSVKLVLVPHGAIDEGVIHEGFQCMLESAGIRHGHRNPEEFLPNDPNAGRWGLEGELQLTNVGKRQAHSLGKALRVRYGLQLSDQFKPKQVKAMSSSADRAQSTMQTFLNGLFPPMGRSVWNPSVPWQPIPMEINDPMLRMYHIENCVTAKEATDPISDAELPGLRSWLNRETRVVNYVSQNTGWKPTLRTLTLVSENIKELETLKLPLPQWINSPTLSGFNKTLLVHKIKEFGEAREMACANHAPCRNIMAGVWLDEISKRLKQRMSGENTDLRLVAYASHTEVLFPVMKLLGMDNEELPPSAGFIIEYRDKPEPALRILYHEPDSENPDIRFIFVANQLTPCPYDWCPLDKFLAMLRPNAISDWRLACRVKDYCATQGDKNAISSTSSRYHRQKPINPDLKVVDCGGEKDTSPTQDCQDWAEHNYCNEVMPVRYLFCRHTCLCTHVILKN